MTNDELYDEYCVDNKARDNRSLDSKKHNKTHAYIKKLKAEVKSLKEHLLIATTDINKLAVRDIAIQSRMGILNGMLSEAHHENKVLRDINESYRKGFNLVLNELEDLKGK